MWWSFPWATRPYLQGGSSTTIAAGRADASLQGPCPSETVPGTVLCEVDDKGIATLTINRPEALNALNGAVLSELRQAISSVQEKAKAILITGSGKAFVAGADIAAMAHLSR